jgi:signal transduction histidine kinase
MHDLPVVWGNSDLLSRVFQNLFTNAIKYNHREKVEISISFDGIVQRGIGEFAQITVADNGPGISPGDAGRVFTMFARGNGAERGSEGLGIGLAIVQRIVELHHGLIDLSSRPDEGARFTIFLPTGPIEPFKV